MSLKVKQEAVYKGNKWWKWSVWLDGTKAELDEIQHVDYHLHPTFSPPIVRVTKRETNFRLNSSGWGMFEMNIETTNKNGRTKTLCHELELEYPKPAPKKASGSSSGKMAGSRAASLKGGSKKSKSKNAIEPVAEPFAVESAPTGGINIRLTFGDSERPQLFLSCGVADMPFARLLSAALEREGIDVAMPADETSDMPLDVYLRSMLERAAGAVFVVSEQPGAWLIREIEAAHKQKVRIIPVIVGQPSNLPPLLNEAQGIRVKDDSSLNFVAERLKEIFLP